MLGPWSWQRSCYCRAHASLPQGWKCVVVRDLSLSRCRKAFLAGDWRKCPANRFSFRSTLHGSAGQGSGKLTPQHWSPMYPTWGSWAALYLPASFLWLLPQHPCAAGCSLGSEGWQASPSISDGWLCHRPHLPWKSSG